MITEHRPALVPEPETHNPGRKVHSYDEWSSLDEVIVGDAALYTSHLMDASFRLFYYENVQSDPSSANGTTPRIDIPPQLLDELLEDIEGFVKALEGCGVSVLRPAPLEGRSSICSPLWSSEVTPALNVRDQTIILGETILETAPHVRSRYFENDQLKPIFYQYFFNGSRWLSMPRPALARGSLDESFFSGQGIDVSDIMLDQDAHAIPSLGHEIIFDGAQCIRLGRDVLVNVANRNHALAFDWLVATLADEFTFHRLEAIADSHIDSIVVPLRPGLLMLRSPDFLEGLPAPLQAWDVIYPPEIDRDSFPDYADFGFNIASRHIDMNVLSIDEETVVVNSLCAPLIEVLEGQGFNVVPVRHRHRRLFGGGFHCFTLDTVRSAGCEDYLS